MGKNSLSRKILIGTGIGLLTVLVTTNRNASQKPLEPVPSKPNSIAVVYPYTHLTSEERASLENIQRSSEAAFCAYVSGDLQRLKDARRMLMGDYSGAGQEVREASRIYFIEGVKYLRKGFNASGKSRLASECDEEACALEPAVCWGD